MANFPSQWEACFIRWCLVLLLSFHPLYAFAQGLEKALITHSSDSITTALLTYGIERGFYRRAGVDLEFRPLRGDLAISAMIGSKEVEPLLTLQGAIEAVEGAFRAMGNEPLLNHPRRRLHWAPGDARKLNIFAGSLPDLGYIGALRK